MTYQCSKCKLHLLIEDFYKNSSKLLGRSSECKKCSNEHDRKYKKTVKGRVSANKASYKWRMEHPEKWALIQRRHNQKIERRLATGLRFRLREALRAQKAGSRNGSAIRDLGCTIEFFKQFIADKFQTGMSWDNYGKWHLDHIRPLSSFNLSDYEDIKIACSFENYQPLWALDNIKKSNKWGV